MTAKFNGVYSLTHLSLTTHLHPFFPTHHPHLKAHKKQNPTRISFFAAWDLPGRCWWTVLVKFQSISTNLVICTIQWLPWNGLRFLYCTPANATISLILSNISLFTLCVCLRACTCVCLNAGKDVRESLVAGGCFGIGVFKTRGAKNTFADYCCVFSFKKMAHLFRIDHHKASWLSTPRE